MNYQHLLGRTFLWRERDCYALLRDFYRDVFDIDLPNFARPPDFYQKGLDLFREQYQHAGFTEINIHPSQIKIGDVAISAIDSSFGNHCSIFVENGRVLHHLHGRLSEVTPFRGLVRNTCVGFYRHHGVPDLTTTLAEKRDLRDFLSPTKQKLLDELRANYSGPQKEAV